MVGEKSNLERRCAYSYCDTLMWRACVPDPAVTEEEKWGNHASAIILTLWTCVSVARRTEAFRESRRSYNYQL